MRRRWIGFVVAIACTARNAEATSIPVDPDSDEARAIFVEYLGGRQRPVDSVKKLQAFVVAPLRSVTSRAFALHSLTWIDSLEPDLSLRSYFAEMRSSGSHDWRSATAAIMGWAVRIFDPRVVPDQRIRKLRRLAGGYAEEDLLFRDWAAIELCALGEPLGERERAAIERGYGATASAVLYWCDSVFRVLRAKAWGNSEAAMRAIDLGDWSWSGTYRRTVLLSVSSDSRASRDPVVIKRILQLGTGDADPEDLVTLRDILPELRAQGWTNEALKQMSIRPEVIERLTNEGARSK